jgi:uncharacterized cupin superfamily protein
MIIRRNTIESVPSTEEQADKLGRAETCFYSDAGGITQFGAHVQTLLPNALSSARHWHEHEDEFLYVLSGVVTVIENDGEHELHVGDAACWPAGTPNAHQVVNRSSVPCTYLIVGTRARIDNCHYPDTDRVLHVKDGKWWLCEADGSIIRTGEM